MKYSPRFSFVGPCTIAAAAGLLQLSVAAHAQEFSYNGDTGPAFWSELNPTDWAACAGGDDAAQSPMEIRLPRKSSAAEIGIRHLLDQ